MNESLNYFLPYQIAWIQNPAPLVIGEKSRRIGWTYASSYRAVERRVANLGNLYFSSADLTAAREFIDYCEMWAGVFNVVATETTEKEVIDDKEITSLVLTFNNGRKIVAGSSNPKFFRSKGGDADGDEFGFHKAGRELLKAMHATALFWGHQLRLWSTHNGQGSYFNALVKEARKYEEAIRQSGDGVMNHTLPNFRGLRARLQTVTVLDAVEQGLVEKILKLENRDDKARQEWLDNLRATCPDQDTWNEEYMCTPSSEANALLSYDLIGRCERGADELRVVEDPRELKTNCPLYAGFDVGRKADLSVFWVLGQVGDVFETRLVKRFSKAPYALQEDYLNLLMQQGIRRVCIDSTGIGNMLAERAVQRFGGHRAEAVNFSAPVKADLAMPLVRLFEDTLIRIPADPAVRESLHKVRKIVTTAGNVRFDAKHDEDGHADEFWALALAYHAADALKIPWPKVSGNGVGW